MIITFAFFFFFTCFFAEELPEQKLAQRFFAKKDFIKAIEYYQKALRLQPDNPEIYYSIGKIRFLEQNWKEAFLYLRETIALQKEYQDALPLFNETISRLEKSDEIQKDLSELAFNFKIYLLIRQNQLQEALLVVREMMKYHPDSGWAWDHLANLAYREKRLEDSLEYLKKAMTLLPSSPTIFQHYQTTYQFVHHKITSKTAISLQNSKANTASVTDPVLSWIDEEILVSKEPEIIEKKVAQVDPQKTNLSDQSFFKKLLQKESQFIAIASETPTFTETKEEKIAWVPPPPVEKGYEEEKNKLISRAHQAFNEKNWQVAYQAFENLSLDDPKNQEYHLKMEEAKKFQTFELEYSKARSYIARARKDPQYFVRAKEIILTLDPKILYELYKKPGFDDILGKIHLSLGELKNAQKNFHSWLEIEKQDMEIWWLLLECTDSLGEMEKTIEIYDKAVKLNAKEIQKQPGASRLKFKIFLYKWRFLFLFLLTIWLVSTLIYFTAKAKKQKRKMDRESRFESVKNFFADKRWIELNREIDSLLMEDLTAAEVYNLQYQKATALYQLNHLDKAEKLCQSILAQHKKDPKSLLLLAKIHATQKNLSSVCLEEYQLLCTKEGTNLDWLKIYLKCLKTNGIFNEQTEKTALRILEIESYNKEILKELVEIYIKTESLEPKTCDIFKRYLDLNPSESSVLLHYLKVLIKNENFIDAIKTAKKLLNLNPDLDEAHRYAIEAYNSLSMHEELGSFYTQISLEFPSSTIVQKYFQLVEANYSSRLSIKTPIQDTDSSQELTKKAMKDGIELLEKKMYKDALIRLQTASTNPDQTQKAKLLSVLCHIRLNDWESAFYYFNQLELKLQKLEPRELEVLYEVACQYQAMEEREKALKTFQMIARNDVSFKDTFQKIEILSMK